MSEREPLYRALADVIISGGGANARKVARQIETELRERGLISRGDHDANPEPSFMPDLFHT